jgi:hypothetical protein
MMMKELVVANYHGHTVEIESVYECGGVKLATVHAIAGEPFVAGLTYPVRSAYGVVRVSELTNACYAWMTGKALHLRRAVEVG